MDNKMLTKMLQKSNHQASTNRTYMLTTKEFYPTKGLSRELELQRRIDELEAINKRMAAMLASMIYVQHGKGEE